MLSKLPLLPQVCKDRFRRAKGGSGSISRVSPWVSWDAEAFRKEEGQGKIYIHKYFFNVSKCKVEAEARMNCFLLKEVLPWTAIEGIEDIQSR